MRHKTLHIGHAHAVGKGLEHQLVVGGVAHIGPAVHLVAECAAPELLHDPACTFQLVVPAKPAVDVDAADGGVHTLTAHERYHGGNLRVVQLHKFTVVDGNVGLTPGGIGRPGGTGHFALNTRQHLLHAVKVGSTGGRVLLVNF